MSSKQRSERRRPPQALVELQREWAELEGAAERLLTKGEAFQHLTLEMERGVKRNLALDAAATRDGRVKSQRPGADARNFA